MYDNNNNDTMFMDFINIFGTYLGLLNYQENLQQSSNNDIVNELHRQNEIYLKTINEKLDNILSILDNSISTKK